MIFRDVNVSTLLQLYWEQ